MSKENDQAVCRHCGKVLVGNSKSGLCDSCFNKRASKFTILVLGTPIAYKVAKAAKKAIPTIGKTLKNIIRKI